MSIAPIFSSPCDLADQLPPMISDFLDIEQHLKRRFREDSITDILVASLLSLPGNDVVVLTPPEAKTGGDFDLVIVESVSGDAVQFRIQAKRLYPHKFDWHIGSYVELAHPHNSGKQSQILISNLAREAYPTIPLYAFYNPAHVCAASGNAISGIELASGWAVRERIKAIVKAKPKRLPYKRVGSLKSLFFPLSTILCPPRAFSRKTRFPLPREAHSAVVDAIEERATSDDFDQKMLTMPEFVVPALANPRDADEALGRPRSRSARNVMQEVVKSAIDHRQERIITARVRRPTILLIADTSSE